MENALELGLINVIIKFALSVTKILMRHDKMSYYFIFTMCAILFSFNVIECC